MAVFSRPMLYASGISKHSSMRDLLMSVLSNIFEPAAEPT